MTNKNSSIFVVGKIGEQIYYFDTAQERFLQLDIKPSLLGGIIGVVLGGLGGRMLQTIGARLFMDFFFARLLVMVASYMVLWTVVRLWLAYTNRRLRFKSVTLIKEDILQLLRQARIESVIISLFLCLFCVFIVGIGGYMIFSGDLTPYLHFLLVILAFEWLKGHYQLLQRKKVLEKIRERFIL